MPADRTDLSGAPLESLREELNNLNKGLDELLKRRQEVIDAINIKLDDSRSQLISSDEFFAKATGQYRISASESSGEVEDMIKHRKRYEL